MVYRVVYIFIYIVESVDNNKSRWQRGIEVLRNIYREQLGVYTLVYRVVYIFIYKVESVEFSKSRWRGDIEVSGISTGSSWGLHIELQGHLHTHLHSR